MKLTPGIALIIAGPQGSGKTLKARKIAADHGTFAETHAAILGDQFRLGALLTPQPASVLVDETPAALFASTAVKSMVSSLTTDVRRRGTAMTKVPTPNFIFCTSDVDAVRAMPADRRFHVVYLGQPIRSLRCIEDWAERLANCIAATAVPMPRCSAYAVPAPQQLGVADEDIKRWARLARDANEQQHPI